MNKINLTLLVCLISNVNFAQINDKATLNYFDISLSSEIYETVAPNATLQNLAKDIAGDMSENLGDAVSDFPTTGDERTDKLRETVYTEIENMTYKAFGEELKITIEPKDKLAGKIYYFGAYPHLYKFKKVLKSAPGEAFYMSYQVEMYKGGMGVGAMGIEVGGKIKPTTVIKLAIADSKGKVVQEFEIKEKTEIVVGSTKTSVGGVEMSDGASPEDVSAKVLQVYKDALDVLVEEFKKKNKKAYKNA
ncbi:MAG: hypothetical protein ABJH98_03435 [Reichenbachiella sp.]|uniref:hypothetical protein n=1 Tax=Reichenbachiella sp. TaxID=2184521 RepID=UPI003296C0C1